MSDLGEGRVGGGVRVGTVHFTGASGTRDSTTSYYMGGSYEIKDSAVKKYYSIAGMMVATPPCPPQIRME